MKEKNKELRAKDTSGGDTTPPVRVVRSHWDLKNYQDPPPMYIDRVTGEITPGYGPNKVVADGYETIETMIKKFFRGELRPQSNEPMYEFGPDIDPNMALEMMNPLMRRGVDRVDAVNLIRQANDILADHKRKKEGQNDLESEKKEQKEPAKPVEPAKPAPPPAE